MLEVCQTTTIAVNANTNRLSVAGYDASGNMTTWGSNGSYCQKLCIEPSGGDLFLFFSVHELETFNDFGNAPVAL